MASVWFCLRRNLASEVLQDWVWESGSCDACDNLHKEVVVSGLFIEVIPMFCAHAEGSWFAEPWHAFEGGGDQPSNLGQQDVRHRGLMVRISGVQALNFLQN